jgi:hypothetical protein
METSKRPAVEDEPVDKKQKTTNLGGYHRGKTTNPETVGKLCHAQQSASATCWDASRPSQWTIGLGEDIWREYVAEMLTAKELAIASRVSSFNRVFWQEFLSKNTVRVPGDATLLKDGLALCGVLSTIKTYTKAEPLTLMLGPGEHAIDDTWAELDVYGCEIAMRQTTLTTTPGKVCEEEEEEEDAKFIFPFLKEKKGLEGNEHFSLQGCGIDITVVRGGLVALQGMKIKGITFANAHGHGLWVENESTIVEAEDCSFSDCLENGVKVMYHGLLFATRCIFARNRGSGAFNQCELGVFTDCVFQDNATAGIMVCDGDGYTCNVHLVGNQTSVHGNKFGLSLYGRTLIAGFHTSTVYVHLPASHNTFHNNKLQNVRLSPETPATSFQNVPVADSTVLVPSSSARRYFHSKDERDDVLDYYTKRAGDIRNILASIPHSRENDGPRFIKKIFSAIKDKVVKGFAADPSRPQVFYFEIDQLAQDSFDIDFRQVWERYLVVSAAASSAHSDDNPKTSEK